MKVTPMSRVSTENTGWAEGDVSKPSSMHDARRTELIIERKIRERILFIGIYRLSIYISTRKPLGYCPAAFIFSTPGPLA